MIISTKYYYYYYYHCYYLLNNTSKQQFENFSENHAVSLENLKNLEIEKSITKYINSWKKYILCQNVGS